MNFLFIVTIYDHDIGDIVYQDIMDSLQQVKNFLKNDILLPFEEEFDEKGNRIKKPKTYKIDEIKKIVNDMKDKVMSDKFTHWSVYLKGNHRQIIISRKVLVVIS